MAHNELEKTRRANLRSSLEQLRDMVLQGAAEQESSRSTTLGLLTRAKNFIKVRFSCFYSF